MGKIMYFISFSFMTSAKCMLTELVNLAFESDSDHFDSKTKNQWLNLFTHQTVTHSRTAKTC